METTITEALAELKTIKKRVQKKQESIGRYFARQGNVRDPLEKDGGSADFISRERQGITDLHARFINIRTGIQAANLKNSLGICNKNRSVAEWLVWRREVAESERQHVAGLVANLENIRNEARRKDLAIVSTESGDPGEIVISVDERALAEESEHIEEVLGVLDGKLSLFNATTTIELN